MTAVPSLDALLASTPPQPYQPADLGGLLDVVQRNYGLGQHMQDRYRARDRIMQHVNSLRVDAERACLVAVELENENAKLADLLYDAWGVIANGPWSTVTGEDPDEWTAAAIRWRGAWEATLNLGGAE